MDFSFITQAPISTLLVIGGFALVFLSFFDVSKKGITQKKSNSKNNLMITGVGALLILAGIFYNSLTSAGNEVVPTQEIVVDNGTIPDTPTSVPTDLPASTPTDTASPTDTPVPPTDIPTQVPVMTFDDGCIAVQTWQATSTDASALGAISDQNNCWNLNNLDIVAESGGTLHILHPQATSPSASGIYTPVNDNSIIEFKVYVNNLSLLNNDIPGFIGFSIAQQDNATAEKGSGRFKLQVNPQNADIFFVLADTTENNGSALTTQHYLKGRIYTIRMELKTVSMDIYINNEKQTETITIPSGPKIFYIGYSLPTLASADVEISEITVDGKKQ